MIISEQMASSSLFTDMQGSEKRESNLLETPRFRKRKEQVVCISDPTCSDRERERERLQKYSFPLVHQWNSVMK